MPYLQGVFRLRDHKTVHGVLKKLVKSDTVKIQGRRFEKVRKVKLAERELTSKTAIKTPNISKIVR